MFGWFSGKKKDQKQTQSQEKGKQPEEIDNEEDDVIDEAELEAKGFDPLEAYKDLNDKEDECITDFTKADYPDYLNVSAEQMIEIMMLYQYQQGGIVVRHQEGHKNGGRVCLDQKIVIKSRSAGKEIIKMIGKKILSGQFNLTKISFPIRVSVPKTALETAVHSTSIFPIFMSKASYTPDPLERFKLVVTATIASFYVTCTFLKPLNPVLGETLEASYNDGTQVYVEQISHHPPVSYFLVLGPNKMYKYFGYYLVEGRAGLNSVQLISKGKRSIVFKDGQRIDYDFPNELYSGTFFGQLRQESVGKVNFTDQQNGLRTTIEFGKLKKLPTDWFQSDIYQENQKIGQIEGTYIGFIDIDGVRYWDYKCLTPFRIKMSEKPLQSDHRIRADLKTLREGDVKTAQEEKERIENQQRSDKKLRETYQKKK